jgi:hypothetical protein
MENREQTYQVSPYLIFYHVPHYFQPAFAPLPTHPLVMRYTHVAFSVSIEQLAPKTICHRLT